MKTKIQRTPQGLFSLMRRHPYLLTFLICALLLPFGFADRAKITAGSCIYLGIVCAVITIAAVFIFQLGKNMSENLLLSGIGILGIAAVMMIIGYVNNKALAIAIIALIVAVIGVAFIKINFGLSDTAIIALLILLGIAIRFVYVLYTGSGDRQHDVGFWNWKWGHTNYIEFWYKNGLKLPNAEEIKI